MERIVTQRWFRSLAMGMAALMLVIGLVPRVEAGFVPTEQSRSFQTRDSDLGTVQKALENKIVTERLADFGYSPDEVKAKLSLLSDDEVHSLASNIQDLQTGGDAFGIIIAILVVVLLVVLILKLSDKTVTIQ